MDRKLLLQEELGEEPFYSYGKNNLLEDLIIIRE